jgi:anti-repressor protein
LARGWIYVRPGTTNPVGYQSKLDADLLEHKLHSVFKQDGSEMVVTQVRVTPKGLAQVAKELKADCRGGGTPGQP